MLLDSSITFTGFRLTRVVLNRMMEPYPSVINSVHAPTAEPTAMSYRSVIEAQMTNMYSGSVVMIASTMLPVKFAPYRSASASAP